MTGTFRGHRDQHYGHVTYSQHGEDLVVVNLFALLGIDHPSYLDIGCHHPVNISNTYLLYTRGSRGVAVDANTELMGLWALSRPEDKFLAMGVDVSAGTSVYYRYDAMSGRNTMSAMEVARVINAKEMSRLSDQIIVPTTTLNGIVSQHCDGKWPHFLSLDAEGMDMALLTHAQFGPDNAPTIICVEARKEETLVWSDFLADRGYVIETRMGENLIAICYDKHVKLWS